VSQKNQDSSNWDLLATIFGSLVLALGLLFFLVREEDTSPVHVAWLIPVFSVLSFVLILLLGSYDPRRGGSIAVIGVGFSSVFSLGVAYDVLVSNVTDGSYIENTRIWFSWSDNAFEFGTYIDGLAGLLLLVVGFVSYLVVVFSLGYMSGEGDRQVRYFAEISLFVGVMLGLVIANSFLLMFIFWELVGVCSYLLIGFWYEKQSAASAAKKAFLVTRVGDVFLLLGLIILYDTFGTLRYSELFGDPSQLSEHSTELKWATLCLFGGAVGKSAQSCPF
jgi:NADH-quinone oxidoreductase subunit L